MQLGGGLVAPLEVAFLEAPVDSDGQVVRDLEEHGVSVKRGCKEAAIRTYTSGNINNLLNADVSKSGRDDVGWETED